MADSRSIKKKLLKENILEKKCYKCNLKKWNDDDIPLDLHHKDGNHKNNSIENLTFLCPNCHYQEHGKSGFESRKRRSNKCEKCGNKCYYKSLKCSVCYYDNKKSKIMPDLETLKNDLKVHKSLCAIGRKYKVSDNAVRKWFEKYNFDWKFYKKSQDGLEPS